MKQLKRVAAFLVVSLFASSAWAQNWQLVWSDEFNGSIGPDWVFETGNGSGGWGNNELQYYRRENAGHAPMNEGSFIRASILPYLNVRTPWVFIRVEV